MDVRHDESQATELPSSAASGFTTRNMAPTAPEPAPPASRGGGFTRYLWLLALGGAVLLLPFWVERVQYSITRGRQRAMSETAKTQLASLNDTSEAFRLVAQSVEPSVVHIDTFRAADLSQLKGLGEDAAGMLGDKFRATGQGSGVVVDDAGFILTNLHVVQGATEVNVRLSTGRTIRNAVVVGVDEPTDLALLKVDGGGLTSAPWGDSQKLQVGDWVLAVGNPFGLDGSVTAGIVSAKSRRQVVHDLAYQDFLQTDAMVNPGSSGGPLVNLKGEVIGINTAIVGQGYQGISFAIPSHIAADVYQKLKTAGKVARGWLGVALSDANSGNEKEEAIRGAKVESVFPGAPAAKAGIEADDVIVEWNAQPIADHSELSLLVSRTPVDSTADVIVQRKGKRLSLKVVVAQRPTQIP